MPSHTASDLTQVRKQFESSSDSTSKNKMLLLLIIFVIKLYLKWVQKHYQQRESHCQIRDLLNYSIILFFLLRKKERIKWLLDLRWLTSHVDFGLQFQSKGRFMRIWTIKDDWEPLFCELIKIMPYLIWKINLRSASMQLKIKKKFIFKYIRESSSVCLSVLNSNSRIWTKFQRNAPCDLVLTYASSSKFVF